ncbi:nucleoside deaminase [Rhodopirellula halodulae]|uniref:nucleoside deaminase n=1 Tax=Rhodopirellula halodulae TaxID=2894198 RepID=UPI001E42A7D5|nr:nucleoside deaminase [Rhodopirellula sp. JC737]MCC9658373.1 nucleoside deaminase [Rhodopirellula sp. JC737]
MNPSWNIDSKLLRQWMKSVLAVTVEGVARGEHPFGAGVFRDDGSQVAIAHNEVASRNDPTAHAEVLALSRAGKRLHSPDLSGTWLVSSGEPCPMCLSAIALSGIQNVVFGASAGTIEAANFGTLGLPAAELESHLKPSIELIGGVLEYDCSALLINHRKKETQDG